MNSQIAPTAKKRISARKRRQMKNLERHRRRCIVCNHPEREAIEEEFLHWRNAWEIGRQYQLVDYRTIYRHARATGLHLKRRENLHSALDCIVEWSEDVRPTGDVILRAMRAYSCIDSHGRWTDPPKQVIFTSFQGTHPTNPPTPGSSAAGSRASASNVPGSEVIDLDLPFKKTASHSDATACAAPPAQAFAVDEGEFDELDEADMDEEDVDELDEADEESAAKPDEAEDADEFDNEELDGDDSELEGSEPTNDPSQSDATACAASPAQAFVGAKCADAVEPVELVDAEFVDELADADLADAEEADECDEEAVEAAEFDDELDGDLQDDPTSQSDQPLALIHPRNSSQLPQSEKSASRDDSTACAAPPAQAFVGANRADAVELVEVVDAEFVDELADADLADAEEADECDEEAVEAAEFDDELDGDSQDDPTSQSDQPLALIHPRNSSQLPQSERSASRGDSTACAAPPAQAFVGAKCADAVELVEVVDAEFVDGLDEAELDEAEEDTDLDEAEDGDETDDQEPENGSASRSDQPLAQIHPRNSSLLPQSEKSASRSDQPLAQIHPRNSSPSPRRGAQESLSLSDSTACAASPAQPAPPNPERSPYYTELLITCAPKHGQPPTARTYPPTLPPEPRRASPEERRDADLRSALPHPPDPSQPLQPHHYLELLDRCLDPVGARKLRPVGRRKRKRRSW